MPGPNLTGQPKTEDYNLGRGILYFAPISAVTGLPGAYRDLGNAPEFKITTAEETLKHTSSRQGLRFTDAEVVLSKDTSFNFQLDEVNDENLALLFSGTQSTHTNVAIAGFTEYEMIADVEMGRWYDLRNAAGSRAYDVLAANLTVEKSGAPDVAMVLNTDYLLDSEGGRIFILSTGIVVVAGDAIDVTLAADAGAKVIKQVEGMTQSSIKGALKFIGSNPQNNDAKTEIQFHKASLKADGDFSLIGDDWTLMPFTGTAERNSLMTSSPTLTIRNLSP